MWGSDYPDSESTFPQSRKILAGVPDDEQAKIAGGNTASVYNFDVARLTAPAWPTSLPIDELGVTVLFTAAARFQSWLDAGTAWPGARRAGHRHPDLRPCDECCEPNSGHVCPVHLHRRRYLTAKTSVMLGVR